MLSQGFLIAAGFAAGWAAHAATFAWRGYVARGWNAANGQPYGFDAAPAAPAAHGAEWGCGGADDEPAGIDGAASDPIWGDRRFLDAINDARAIERTYYERIATLGGSPSRKPH